MAGDSRRCAASTARPARVLGIGLALAVLGLALDTQTKVVSDVQKLVPQDLPALRDLSTLQRSTGVSGEIDVTVAADDLTDPAVIGWMSSYQARRCSRATATPRSAAAARPSCARRCRCPTSSAAQGAAATRQRIQALLDAVPPYFSQAVITRDRRDGDAGVRDPADAARPAAARDRRDAPPPASAAGRQGRAGRAAGAGGRGQRSAISSHWRRLLTLLAGLLAVALVLLAVYRRAERALVPLVPIALASGWSALVAVP